MKRLLAILCLLPLLLRGDFGLDSPAFMGLLNRSQAPVDPVLAFTPALSAWLPFTNLATSGTDVTFVPDLTGNWHAAVATNSSNPTATNNGTYFDGSTDQLAFINWNAPTEKVSGVTNATTGVCYDSRDDTLWRADFRTGELVNCNQAGRQIARISTSVGTEDIQGIVSIPSSGNFWAMDVIDTTVFKIDATGATLYSTNVGATYEPNGVCYDAATGQLHILAKSGVIYTYNESDFSYVGSITATTTEPDGIWIGTNGNFFVSQDGSGFNASAVLEIDPADGSTLATYDLPHLDNIEHGCQIPNGRVYIGVDDQYHASGTRVDYIARLKSDFTPDDIGRDTTGVTIMALLKPSANPATTRFAFFLADGATVNVVRQGAAVGVASGDITAIGRKNDGGSSGVATIATTIPTSEYTLVAAVLDYGNATISAYTNGVLGAQNTSFFTAGSSTNSVSVYASVGSGKDSAYFAGELVHLWIWNEALDATEVANFNAFDFSP